MHIRTHASTQTWVALSLLSIRLSRLTCFLTFWSGLVADNLGRRGAGSVCLLELKGLQVVHCYHSQPNWRQSWHSCLWELPLLFLWQRDWKRWRETKRGNEREREVLCEQEWMENIFKEKVPTSPIRSSRSTWVPEVCNWIVKDTAKLSECHLAREKRGRVEDVGGEGVAGGWGGSVINPFTSSPVLFAPMDSARVSPFRLVYLASRVWLKKIPTAWGGIGAEVEGDVGQEGRVKVGCRETEGGGVWGGTELLKAVSCNPPSLSQPPMA